MLLLQPLVLLRLLLYDHYYYYHYHDYHYDYHYYDYHYYDYSSSTDRSHLKRRDLSSHFSSSAQTSFYKLRHIRAGQSNINPGSIRGRLKTDSASMSGGSGEPLWGRSGVAASAGPGSLHGVAGDAAPAGALGGRAAGARRRDGRPRGGAEGALAGRLPPGRGAAPGPSPHHAAEARRAPAAARARRRLASGGAEAAAGGGRGMRESGRVSYIMCLGL